MTSAVRAASACVLLTLGCVMVGGCGGSRDKELLEHAEKSVDTALSAWKNGGKPEALKTAADPIDAYDEDWLRGVKLLDFKRLRSFIDTDGLPRCTVELQLQSESNPPQTLTTTYQVVNKPPTTIARDPFN